MTFLKPYSNIKSFLERFTILKIGKLHIRIHNILDRDRTTLYHNHPFNYISFVISGGYTEKYVKNGQVFTKTHGKWSFIFRKNDVKHRIESVKPGTKTLFFAYGNYKWAAENIGKSDEEDGVFERIVGSKTVFSKRANGIWFIGNRDRDIAVAETRHSIHQV